MKYEKPDGIIEIASSACCCPPDTKRSGMHTNACTNWWRVTNGKWHKLRSLTFAMTVANNTETSCADFIDTMNEYN
jgi:hypothetical protein